MGVSVSAPYPSEDVWGAHPVALVQVTFDSSYPTGGEAFNPATYVTAGSGSFVVMPFARGAGAGCGVWLQYDYANKKLVAYDAGGQVTDTADLSTLVADVLILHKPV